MKDSGRILADVEVEVIEEEKPKKAAPVKRAKSCLRLVQ